MPQAQLECCNCKPPLQAGRNPGLRIQMRRWAAPSHRADCRMARPGQAPENHLEAGLVRAAFQRKKRKNRRQDVIGSATDSTSFMLWKLYLSFAPQCRSRVLVATGAAASEKTQQSWDLGSFVRVSAQAAASEKTQQSGLGPAGPRLAPSRRVLESQNSTASALAPC